MKKQESKEFNLSEKIREANCFSETTDVIHIYDVKEFIKRLKKELKRDYWTHYKRYSVKGQAYWIDFIVNKLAGDKLTK